MKYPNWFEITGAQDNFARHLEYYKGKPVKFLQIGAFTGDASVWMLKNILTHPDSVLVDVDTWRGSDEQEHNAMDFDDVFDVYLKRIADYKNVSPLRMTSDEFFANKTMLFDFIYIDGDHTAFSVMKDLINAHSRINTNGIIACDDYHWSEGKGLFYEPRPAIDAFFNMTRDFYEVIEVGPQVWFRDARSV